MEKDFVWAESDYRCYDFDCLLLDREEYVWLLLIIIIIINFRGIEKYDTKISFITISNESLYMKNLIFISALVFVIISCQGDIIAQSNLIKSDSLQLRNMSNSNQKKTLIDGVMSLDFRRDFKVRSNVTRLRPTDEEHIAVQFSSKRSNIKENYSSIKPKFIEWAKVVDERSVTVQSVALRYLRNYFLERTDAEAMDETSILFRILIKHNAIDLDVLADAYMKLLPTFNDEEKAQYFNYIEALHHDEISVVKQNALELKKQYEQEDNERSKKMILFKGKDIERRSKSCAYVRELMDIELP